MVKEKALIITLGTSWELIPEIFIFSEFDIIKTKTKKEVPKFSEIWGITTNESFQNLTEQVDRFLKLFKLPVKFKLFFVNNVNDLETLDDCHFVADAIFKIVYTAKQQFSSSNLIIAPAGGRKTMSFDLLRAANLFGCNSIIHILSKGRICFRPEDLFQEKTFDGLDEVKVVLYDQNVVESPICSFIKNFKSVDYVSEKISSTIEIIPLEPRKDFLELIEKMLKNSYFLAYNYYHELLDKTDKQSNFYALYTLSPKILEQLSEKIDQKSNNHIDFISKIPKTDLHFHLGGSLSTQEIIQTARSNEYQINLYKNKYKDYKDKLVEISNLILEKDVDKLNKIFKKIKQKKYFSQIPEPFGICGFLSLFEINPQLLEKLNYGKFNNERCFTGIGISKYMEIGDIQGSSILKTENSLRKACELIKLNTKRNNVIYQEIRCSPLNYTTENLSATDVIRILWEELNQDRFCLFKLIIIGTRHKNIENLKEHIQLTLEMSEKYPGFIVAFDLAGDESAADPEKLREYFLPLMEKCIHITIHAGETAPVENIWQAIYHLNAERIGHGLNLHKNPYLYEKFKNHSLYIEMCPNSNYQIVGYSTEKKKYRRKFEEYPFKKYFDDGLKVTVNTDNTGISKTNITKEYLRLIELSDYSLSLWDILKIVRNGFKAAFLPLQEKSKLILEAEKQIVNLIKKDFTDVM